MSCALSLRPHYHQLPPSFPFSTTHCSHLITIPFSSSQQLIKPLPLSKVTTPFSSPPNPSFYNTSFHCDCFRCSSSSVSSDDGDVRKRNFDLKRNGTPSIIAGSGCCQHPLKSDHYKWVMPRGMHVALNCDGSIIQTRIGVRAGIGCIFRNSDGNVLEAFAGQCFTDIDLETPDIDEVEIWAIWKGLKIAKFCGYMCLSIQTDSRSSICIIFGVKSPPNNIVRKYVGEIRAMLDDLDQWTFSHVYRETNQAADVLSKQCQDKLREIHMKSTSELPKELSLIVREDKEGVYHRREK